jgi:hypothetical protein
MRGILLAAAAAAVAMAAYGEPVPVFTVDFSNPGLTPSHWTLEVHADGQGHFRSERGAAMPAEGARGIEPPDVDRDVQLSQRFADHVFKVARRQRFFAKGCEGHLKVAFQGMKKLSYAGPDGQGGCEFNYSKDAEIQALGDSLVAVATTIIEGSRLESLLQHDRLGLDREMEIVQDALGDGRAQQICSIRDILERVSDDTAVMDRVRKRARELLARADD